MYIEEIERSFVYSIVLVKSFSFMFGSWTHSPPTMEDFLRAMVNAEAQGSELSRAAHAHR